MREQRTQVCVLTARGMSAIASVALVGPAAPAILEAIFQPAGNSDSLQAGQIRYGTILDGSRSVDEVVVGVEGEHYLVIHCHGNPLLVEQIVRLCQARGAEPAAAETLIFQRHAERSHNLIETEARLAMQKSATLTGVKILQGQMDAGLSCWAAKIIHSLPALEDLQQQARAILDRSAIAERIISGVRIVLAGPPNSGKSTLLNCLSGRQETLVSDTAGTTRDWVSVHCQLGPVYAEFTDTAGLDEVLAAGDTIEQTAQALTRDLLDICDLIVYVQDATATLCQTTVGGDKPVVHVMNKCDLIEDWIPPTAVLKPVYISARKNLAIDVFVEAVLTELGVDQIQPDEPVAFTERQRFILRQLLDMADISNLKSTIQTLLFGANRL